jgi:hypothetical protein
MVTILHSDGVFPDLMSARRYQFWKCLSAAMLIWISGNKCRTGDQRRAFLSSLGLFLDHPRMLEERGRVALRRASGTTSPLPSCPGGMPGSPINRPRHHQFRVQRAFQKLYEYPNIRLWMQGESMPSDFNPPDREKWWRSIISRHRPRSLICYKTWNKLECFQLNGEAIPYFLL